MVLAEVEAQAVVSVPVVEVVGTLPFEPWPDCRVAAVFDRPGERGRTRRRKYRAVLALGRTVSASPNRRERHTPRQ